MTNNIAKKHKNVLKKIHNHGIEMIEAPANYNTSWVITFEQHIKIASNLVKVSSIP